MPETPSKPSHRILLWLELGLVVAVSIGSLLFRATLPGRIPLDSEYRAAAKALGAGLATGDRVAILPFWAEKARMLMPGVPFISKPDLADADLSRVRRLWLLEIPTLPRADVPEAEQAVTANLRFDGYSQKFGHLLLKRYSNPTFHEPIFNFTRDIGKANVWIQFPGRRIDCKRDGEAHDCGQGLTVAHQVREIDFTPYDCVGANPIGRDFPLVVDYPKALLGKTLDVMAAVTGEMGWRHGEGRTPVTLTIQIDGNRAGDITIPVGTVPPQRLQIDTSKVDRHATHDVRFAVTTENPKDREFCFDAASE